MLDAKKVSYINALSLHSFPRTAYRFARRNSRVIRTKGFGFVKIFDDLCDGNQFRQLARVAKENDIAPDYVVKVRIDSLKYLGKQNKAMIIRGRNLNGKDLAAIISIKAAEREVVYMFGGDEVAKETYGQKAPLVLIPPADWTRAIVWSAELRISPYEIANTTFLNPGNESTKDAIERAIFDRKKDIITQIIINHIREMPNASIDEIVENVKALVQDNFTRTTVRKLMPKRYYDHLASAGFDALLNLYLNGGLESDRAVFLIADESYQMLLSEFLEQTNLSNVFIVKASQFFTESALGRAAMLNALGFSKPKKFISEVTENERKIAEKIASEIAYMQQQG